MFCQKKPRMGASSLFDGEGKPNLGAFASSSQTLQNSIGPEHEFVKYENLYFLLYPTFKQVLG
jgi:hypothetical protein